MKINYIVLEGFKIFKERIKIDLYRNTLIQACNFQGKTSIAEAIAYGFCGISLNGESRNIEDLINHDSDELRVEINFNDDNDKNHTLIRIKNKKNQVVFLDDEEEPTTQNNINSFIGDPKLFLSCFNLGFFQQELEDSERRNLIVQYAPAIDMIKLFGEISDSSYIEKYNIQTHKTSEYSRLNKLKSQTDEAIKEINVKVNVLLEQNNTDSNEASNYINLDETKEKELKQKIEEMHEMQIHNSQIKAECEMHNQKVLEYNKNVEKAKEIKIKFEQIRDLKPKTLIKDTQKFKEIEDKLLNLIKKEASISIEKICQSCGNELTNEQMEKNIKIKEELNKLIQQVQKNKEEIIKNDQVIEEENNQLINQKNQLQFEVNNIFNLIKEPPKAQLQGMYDLSNYETIKKEYEIIINNNNEIRIKNAKIAEKVNAINDRVKEISNLTQHKNQLEVQSKELESALKALSPSSGIFRKSLEIKSNFIKSELENCSIILEKMQKNGDIKECFEIYFKNTPYRRLSYSEQMLCSLEIAKFLRTQSKKNLPIFIDNKESISNVTKELLDSDQIIYCKVEADKKLEILEIK